MLIKLFPEHTFSWFESFQEGTEDADDDPNSRLKKTTTG
jgi:hypothetical protein